jgi:hypothetical protein
LKIAKGFLFPPFYFFASGPARLSQHRGPARYRSRAAQLRSPPTAQPARTGSSLCVSLTGGARWSSPTSGRTPSRTRPRALRPGSVPLPPRLRVATGLGPARQGRPSPFIARRHTEAPKPSYTASLPPHNPRPPPPLSIPLGRCLSFIVELFRRFVRR